MNKQVAIKTLLRSKGDQALFGCNTQSMKARWKVPAKRSLADFAPTIILKAKDFATEITILTPKKEIWIVNLKYRTSMSLIIKLFVRPCLSVVFAVTFVANGGLEER